MRLYCVTSSWTPKERELASLVAKGFMNREIAEAMNIAVRTVEVHRRQSHGKNAGR
ncbi:Transcriptional regulatory protein fixJ [Salmonella enterica subsp. enterica]|uniref:Transcriptional regulatory protein fixJ n=1 Tax=Salmonella enterica I TaxID=59201 RepID=A0A447U3Z5_SALET|nr:Transcriptional regulatory protein fixJ [Salmonella enterica subsp. enterica]